jgi:hypothetical protein
LCTEEEEEEEEEIHLPVVHLSSSCAVAADMNYIHWYSVVSLLSLNILSIDCWKTCDGKEMADAIIRVCTGARFLLANDVVLQSPALATEGILSVYFSLRLTVRVMFCFIANFELKSLKNQSRDFHS